MKTKRVCFILALCGLAIACDSSTTTTPSPSATAHSNRAAMVNALDSLRNGTSGYSKPTVASVKFPRDQLTHNDARSELWNVYAVVFDEDGNEFGLQQQFARLALRNREYTANESESAWAFRDVMHSSHSFGMGQSKVFRQSSGVQRLALELSGVSAIEGHVWFGNHELQIADAEPFDKCKREHRYTDERAVQLIFLQDTCPSVDGGAGIVVLQGPSMPVTGELTFNQQSQAVSGRGWLRQAWGEIPATGGAVVFDQAMIYLDDLGSIDVSRSKRRSGRGPATVTASFYPSGANTGNEVLRRSLKIDMVDEGQQRSTASGSEYPERWRIRSDNPKLDITLTPIVAMQEVDDLLATAWRGAVLASGSHGGVGFVEFTALSP